MMESDIIIEARKYTFVFLRASEISSSVSAHYLTFHLSAPVAS